MSHLQKSRGYGKFAVTTLRRHQARPARALATVVFGLGWFMPCFAQSKYTVTSAEPQPQPAGVFVLKAGTRIPLALTNSVSTKQAARGDQVYLQSLFPVTAGGRVVIPAGSHISGTVSRSKRPGRVKGRGALFIRFESMVLPNGVTRDFRARVGGLDPRASGHLDPKEGKISSRGNKKGDAGAVAGAIGVGATVGGFLAPGIGSVIGSGIGAMFGGAAGLGIVLARRGPDAVLARGTQLDMVLDRDLSFTEAELQFAPVAEISPANLPDFSVLKNQCLTRSKFATGVSPRAAVACC